MCMNSQPEESKCLHRLRVAAAWGLCVLPVLALAEMPQAFRGRPVPAAGGSDGTVGQPIGPAAGAPQNQGDSPDNQPPGPRQRFNGGMPGQISQQDWDTSEQWMEQNAPRRWAYLQSIKSTNAADFRREFREFFVPRIRQINWLKQNDAKLYDLRMKRITLEDQAFGMLQDLGAAKDTDAKATLTSSLKEKLGEMYDNTLDERKHRIDELATILQTEQAKLKDDEQPDKREKHVENSLSRALQTGSLEAPPHDNNPHMPHGGGPPASSPPTTQPSPAH
jgi:hypothetical protein